VTSEPDVVTLYDLDWSKDDEELARLIGRPAAIVAEFRRRMISGGDGRRRKWMKPPPEVIALWRDEARDHTVGELTRVWRLTLQGVQRRLKRHGLTAAPPKSRKGHKRVATTETVERWRREAALHTADELARMWGVTERTVFTRAWRHGFTVRARGRRTPERVVEQWRRQARGRTIAELAALWGVPRSTARGRVRRHGLPVKRREAEPQPWTKLRRDVKEMRRDAEGRTISELAELWGVSKQRAHQLVKKHDLPARVRRRKRRTPSE